MILASQSPRRIQLLSEAGYAFRSVPSRIDEQAVRADSPEGLSRALASAKALACAPAALPDEIVIGSDTVVALGTEALGKPADDEDARSMLRRLSGATHDVTTSVCLVANGRELAAFSETARVTFWDLEDGEIDSYVATGEPADKAGAYGIQGKGRLLVRRIEGDFYTVVGLPVSRLVRLLRSLGFPPSRRGRRRGTLALSALQAGSRRAGPAQTG